MQYCDISSLIKFTVPEVIFPISSCLGVKFLKLNIIMLLFLTSYFKYDLIKVKSAIQLRILNAPDPSPIQENSYIALYYFYKFSY